MRPLFENRWRSQPQCPVRIDYSNPLTQFLQLAAMPGNIELAGARIPPNSFGGAISPRPTHVSRRGPVQAWNFPGTTALRIPDSAGLNLPTSYQAFTIFAIVFPAANNATIASKRSTATSNWQFFVGADDTIGFRTGNTATSAATSNTSVANGTNICAASWRGTGASQCRMFLNGTFSDGTMADNPAALSADVLVGARWNVDATSLTAGLTGSVPLIYIWNGIALPDEAIFALFQNPWDLYEPLSSDTTFVPGFGGAPPSPTLGASGPSTAVTGVASTNFTVTGSDLAENVTVTPHRSSGVFSVTDVTLVAPDDSATFTITGSTIGLGDITFTNNKGLSNPAALPFEVTDVPPITIPTITAERAFVANLDDARTYYTKGTGVRIPASTTKLVTMLTARAYLSISASITVITADIVAGSPTFLNGDIISVGDLIKLAALPSSNTSANALARSVGATLPGVGTDLAKGIAAMNAMAVSLGMDDTLFEDASGLDEDNTTTPEDLHLALEAFYADSVLMATGFLARVRVVIDRAGTPTTLVADSTNVLNGAIGITAAKTGSLGVDGATASNVAEIWEAPNGQRIGITVMRSSTLATRFTDVETIIAQIVIDYPELNVPATPFTVDRLYTTKGHGGAQLSATGFSNKFQDAAGTVPCTANDDPVGQWQRLIPATSAIAFTQSTAGARPLIKTSTPRILADGSNDFLAAGTTLGATSLYAGSSNKYLLAIRFIGSSADAAATIMAQCSATAGNKQFQTYWDTGSAVPCGIFVRGTSTVLPETVNDDAAHVVTHVWDGTTYTHCIDESGSRQIQVGTASEESTQEITMFTRTFSSPAAFMTGSIDQIVFLDKTSAVDPDDTRRLRWLLMGGTPNAFADPTGGEGGADVPSGLSAPTAAGGDTQATVTLVTPSSDGGAAITGYTVTSNPAGGTDQQAGTLSLIHTITGLTNGQAYTFTFKAENIAGLSAASAASNSVTPAVGVPGKSKWVFLRRRQ